uniref:Putative HNH homing endonuclease n=1 Tax=viral metagenome TaxID=1070528 RepID=A0A6H1ZDF0_9ZZZZ
MAVKPATIALAYCAGLIDGEGCISIGKKPRVTHNNLGNNQNPKGKIERKDTYTLDYKLNIIVVQKDKILCDWLRGNFGGSIGMVYRNRSDGQIDEYFRWCLGTNPSTALLKKLKPYLILKKAQAIVAIEFGKHYHRTLGKWKTKENLKKREEYYQKLRQLKREFAVATTKPNPDLKEI